jgi:tetratricopeptide (TPR) repeat protein
MPQETNNPFRFRHELRRRKVIRTTLIYLASAFAILEATDIIFPRLGFPEWTLTLIIYLLGLGLIVVIILSWIYDITPEGIKITESLDNDTTESEVKDSKHVQNAKIWKILTFVSIVIITFFVILRLIEIKSDPNIGEQDIRSIAVMPFQNLTGDTSLDYLETGVSELLINGLGNSVELSVRPGEKIHEVLTDLRETQLTSLIPSIEAEAARKTLSTFYVQGNFQLVNNQIHILVNLVNTDNSEIEWATKSDGNQSEYIQLVDSISDLLKEHLEIKSLLMNGQRDMITLGTNSTEAYKYSILAKRAHYDVDFPLAIKYWNEALKHDSSFLTAYSNIAQLLSNSGQYENAEVYRKKAYTHYDKASVLEKIELDRSKAFRENKDMRAVIRYQKEKIKLGASSRGTWYDLGHAYRLVQQYENAIEPFERAIKIDKSLGGGWKWLYAYYWLGYCYHKTGDFKKENQIYDLALSNLPGHGIIYQRKAILALTKGKMRKFDEYISLFKKWYLDNLDGDYMERELGHTYLGAKKITTAEQHFRNQLEKTPEERIAYYDLGWILINEDIDIDEGLSLIDQAMEMEEGNYTPKFRIEGRDVLNLNSLLYFAKGVGLYKKQNYKEALQLLNAAWQEKALYNHDLFMYIQKTEQALAKKNN